MEGDFLRGLTWQKLGVTNQTLAIHNLRELRLPGVLVLLASRM